ncbi:hypothetical protein Tco_1363421, partial [Tanacetum coccineum]
MVQLTNISVFGAEHLGALESIDPSKQISIIEHYLYILGHLESIDPSICISWKLSSSALEMLGPGHAVGNVMGRGRANVDNIRKISEASVEISDNKSSCGDRYDQDYFPGKRKRGKDYKEGMLAADQPRAPKGLWPSGTHVEVMCPVVGSSHELKVGYSDQNPRDTKWSLGLAYHLAVFTLKGLKRKDVQLLRKFGIQFKGGFENAEVGGDPKLSVVPALIANQKGHSQLIGRRYQKLTLQSHHYLVSPTTAPISIEVILIDELIGCTRLGQEIVIPSLCLSFFSTTVISVKSPFPFPNIQEITAVLRIPDTLVP